MDDRLEAIIQQHDQNQKIGYFLNSGKRLRPLLCLLTFSACNDGDYSAGLDLAAAIELQHSASLVHDDIIDRDLRRRNKTSYYKIFGVEDAILTGHRTIVLGFRCVLNHDPRIISTLFDTWDQSLKGEIEDIDSRTNFNALLAIADRTYYEVIINKTASLFAGASKLGSLQANVPEHIQRLFYEYGKHIGVAYQLADDMHDVGNGYELLPLAWIGNRLDGDTKKPLMKLIGEGTPPHKALTELGIDIHPFFEKEIENAVHTSEDTVKSIPIPNGPFRQMLLETPRYMVDKCLEV